VSSSVSGRILVNNLTDSPFGAGWNIEGLQRLYPQTDGSVLLIDDNGQLKFFRQATPGTGAFADQVRFPSGGNLPRDTRVADVDNDGRTDLILINHDSDDMGLLLGDGNGGFSAPSLFAAVPVDFNSDGRIDVAIANELSDASPS
jgi:hypothetical protein